MYIILRLDKTGRIANLEVHCTNNAFVPDYSTRNLHFPDLVCVVPENDMFKYKVNTRVLAPLRLLNQNEVSEDVSDGGFSERHSQLQQESGTAAIPISTEPDSYQYIYTKFPLINNVRTSSIKKPTLERSTKFDTIKRKVSASSQTDASLQVKVLLDFGYFFGWLERIVWATMALGIGYALIKDFDKATGEICFQDESKTKEHYPFNVLPSLSRTMSSFRLGTFLWTVSMAAAFMARLMSNYFLHRLYETWYAETWFNKIFLFIAYHLDNLEIVTLLMIPAFSLDCDHEAHSLFFMTFLGLTYAAEILQYFTKFLRRNKNLGVFTDDIPNYYTHIGILILLQTFFILWMVTGYLLHEYLCSDFYYSIFTFGEYMTVVINIRFKRDTVLFVK